MKSLIEGDSHQHIIARLYSVNTPYIRVKAKNILWRYEKSLRSNAQKDIPYVTKLHSKSRF